MPVATATQLAAPRPLARLLGGLFQAALLAMLAVGPSVFSHLHRYGTLPLLFGVCQLLALWVCVALLGYDPRYRRGLTNLLVWALLGLLLLHVLPVPRIGPVMQTPDVLGALRGLLVDHGPARPAFAGGRTGRYSLMPSQSAGVLVVAIGAAGLFWTVGSALRTARALRRATWAVALGTAALALWVLIQAGTPGEAADGAAGPMLVPILGGDALQPALLAGLPLAVAVVLRTLGMMPVAPRQRRQSGPAWLAGPPVLAAGVALLLAGLMAAGLGAGHVAFHARAGYAMLAAGMVLLLYVAGPQAPCGRGRMILLTAVTGAWLVAGWLAGLWLAGPSLPASAAPVEGLVGALPHRTLFGYGAGVVSPRALFGPPGWPAEGGADVDTNGYRVLIAEIGWAGLVLAVALAVALAAYLARRVIRARSPWTRLAPAAALGALLANLVAFGADASALLVPNLLTVAAVVGLARGWELHALAYRPGTAAGRVGMAHWPFVVGAVGIAGALGLAEGGMGGPGDIQFSDKALHAGTFAAISLLICYALGPRPTTRHLLGRILLAVGVAAAIGVGIEYAQAWLTTHRSFEVMDIVADGVGAVLVGVAWFALRRAQAGHVCAARVRTPS